MLHSSTFSAEVDLDETGSFKDGIDGSAVEEDETVVGMAVKKRRNGAEMLRIWRHSFDGRTKLCTMRPHFRAKSSARGCLLCD